MGAMSMRYVGASMARVCAICGAVRLGGYIDAGPVDVLCLECGRAVVAAMAQARRAKEKTEDPAEDAQ